MINKVTLIGYVGADPQVRTLEGGATVASMRLATTEKIHSSTSQESREHTEWHRVTAWRGLAEITEKYVRKGSLIYIEGRLRSREWTDREGLKHYGTEVLADEIRLLGGKRSDTSPSSTEPEPDDLPF